MPPNLTTQAADLDKVILSLSNESERLEKHCNLSRQQLRPIQYRYSIYNLLKKLRSFEATFELWPLAVLLVGPSIAGGCVLLVMHELTGSLSVAFTFFVATVVFATGFLALCLYVPKSCDLVRRIDELDRNLKFHRQQFDEVSARYHAVAKSLAVRKEQRKQLLASAQYEREQLLRRNWKAMRSTEWEEFLAEVCHALGGRVELTKTVGDQGVDLVVQFGTKRIAIQAKGYHNSVSNSAVQEAVAGMAHYGCNGCAVMTNSRFTKSAEELAGSNGCTLIGESEFPAFVRGEIVL